MSFVARGRIHVHDSAALGTPPPLRSWPLRFEHIDDAAADDGLSRCVNASSVGGSHHEDAAPLRLCDFFEAPREKVRVEEPSQPLLCPGTLGALALHKHKLVGVAA